jgi:hypothetical protein
MKTIRTTILALFILVISINLSCFNSTDLDKNEELGRIINRSIDFIAHDEENRGGKVDSIFVLCKNPVVVIDSALGRSGKMSCSDSLYSDPRVRLIKQRPDFNQRMPKENVSLYYFFECDTIYLAHDVVTARYKWGTSGARMEVKCVFDRKTLDWIDTKFLEIIQY